MEPLFGMFNSLEMEPVPGILEPPIHRRDEGGVAIQG